MSWINETNRWGRPLSGLLAGALGLGHVVLGAASMQQQVAQDSEPAA